MTKSQFVWDYELHLIRYIILCLSDCSMCVSTTCILNLLYASPLALTPPSKQLQENFVLTTISVPAVHIYPPSWAAFLLHVLSSLIEMLPLNHVLFFLSLRCASCTAFVWKYNSTVQWTCFANVCSVYTSQIAVVIKVPFALCSNAATFAPLL